VCALNSSPLLFESLAALNRFSQLLEETEHFCRC
jgi:hypothetical protein